MLFIKTQRIFYFVLIVFTIMLSCLIVNVALKESYEDSLDKTTNKYGKSIWLLWLQGWDNAPWFVQKVKESWEKYNPEWTVRLLSKDNLKDYIDTSFLQNVNIQNAAISDIVRLSLLSKYGGVWADATMLCMRSLEDWIYEAIHPTGLWMYHGGNGIGPASWFIISIKQNYIINKWKEACDTYWKEHNVAHDYFWMDGLFMDLYNKDTTFKDEWDRVPYLWCEQEGQAHMLNARWLGSDAHLQKIIHDNPPYAIKLFRYGVTDDINNHLESNLYAAIKSSENGLHVKRPLFHMPIIKETKYIFNNNRVIVVSDCGHIDDIRTLVNMAKQYDYQLLIYDKCNFCSHIPDGIYTRPLKNVGREGATNLEFIIRHYDNLPDVIVFAPAHLSKHNRAGRLLRLLQNEDHTISGCDMDVGMPFNTLRSFKLDEHDGKPIYVSSIRPFYDWFQKYIGNWDDTHTNVCWNGILKTTKEKILGNPKQMYINLYNTLIVHNSPESGHYFERVYDHIFTHSTV